MITKREYIIVGIFILIVLSIVGVKYMDKPKEIIFEPKLETTEVEIEVENEESEVVFEDEAEEKWIIVDVCGEVENAGVVRLKEGDRVIDAIESAGGLLDTADRKRVNMARVVIDGEQIYISKQGEETEDIANTKLEKVGNSNKVNINKASKGELQSLGGVGEVLAERIVQHREKNGMFKNIDEIMNVSGIGNKKFESIKEFISVN